MKKDIWIGVDFGSISLKIAALIPTDLISEISAEDLKRKRFFLPNDPSCQKNNKRILLSDYRRHFGQPIS